MKVLRSLLLAVVALGIAIATNAQNTTSPYSMFGYGILNDYATSTQRAMGGVGYAMNSSRQINVMNPASYAAIDSLTFIWDVGVDVSIMRSKEAEHIANNVGGGLDYITMQFPLSKKVGMSAGLLPYSTVGYEVASEIENGSQARAGGGGLNLLYAGIAYSPFKGFSLGVNVGYLFGINIYDNYVYSSSTTLYERVLQVRSWDAKLGLMYSFNVGKKNKVTIGATYAPEKSLHGQTWGAYYDMTYATQIDTIGYQSLKDKNYTPMGIGAGLSYEYDKKVYVEADFTYQNWKDAKYAKVDGFDNNEARMTFDDRWKAAVGVQVTPQQRGGYFKRVSYRVGAYYGHDYVSVRGNNVRECGITCGVGLPAPVGKTTINVGFEYKNRKSHPINYITENYFNITVGVNFNQMWFWKNKLD